MCVIKHGEVWSCPDCDKAQARAKRVEEVLHTYLETYDGASQCACDPPGSDEAHCTGMCYLWAALAEGDADDKAN